MLPRRLLEMNADDHVERYAENPRNDFGWSFLAHLELTLESQLTERIAFLFAASPNWNAAVVRHHSLLVPVNVELYDCGRLQPTCS